MARIFIRIIPLGPYRLETCPTFCSNGMVWSTGAFEILVLMEGLMPYSEQTTSLIAMCVNTETIAYHDDIWTQCCWVSNELGAGNPDRSRKAMAVTLKLSVLLSLIILLSLAFDHNILAGLFIDSVFLFKRLLFPLGVARGCGWQHLAVYVNLGTFHLIGMTVAGLLRFKMKLYAKGLWIGLICGLHILRTKWTQMDLSRNELMMLWPERRSVKMRKGYNITNAEFHEEQDQSVHDLGASTAVTAILMNHIGHKSHETNYKLVVANVGDSRAIICCKNGVAPKQLSVDYFANGPMKEAPRLVRVFQYQWHLVHITFKKLSGVKPDVVVMMIHGETEFLVLASRPLWNVMSNQQVVDSIRQVKNAQEAAEHLILQLSTQYAS
ncbi:hypothetical protein M0R45_014817 [Rubus argutus]|uniref:PPM-type phosphatase domain-containing protein n=1 Tax=Rubus argutus TaxID=59490 RepID=A0AAW1XQY6_RUBAR